MTYNASRIAFSSRAFRVTSICLQMSRLTSALIVASLLLFASRTHATEGGLGRTISGTIITESAGIVSPEPMWAVNFSSIYQDASIGGGRPVPIADFLSLGIHSDLSLTMATLLRGWGAGGGPWDFATSFSIPYDWNKITAGLSTPERALFSETQQASNLFDLYFVPITAGYHFSKTDHLALSVEIWANSGDYDKTRLANPSLNNWTFIPTAAYTKLLPQYGLEFDTNASLQFYTKNQATDYQNAPIFALDLLLLKKFPSGLGIGIISGYTQQIGDDTGPTASKLHGFLGHDITVGPYLSYGTKIGGLMPLSLSLRWVPTVNSENRVNGDAVLGSITVIF